MLTYADDYGNTIPVNSSFVVSPTSQWTLGYIYNAHNNQTQFYDDWTPFHFTSSDFGSIGPAFFLRSGGPGPIFGQGLSTQLEICSGGWSQFPGPSARLLLPQSALNANQDIYFLLTYDNSTRTGTMSVATMVNGSLTLVPTPGPATNYPNTNPGVQTGMNGGADGDRLVNWSTLTGASIKNVCFANKIMTMSQVFGPVPASWTTTGIDGTVPVASDRVLQAGQTDAKQNGIYMVSSDGTQLQRPPDFAAGSHAESAYVFANGPGQSNDNKGFLCTNNAATIVDTDAQTWQVYTAAGGLGGLSVNGSSISSSSPVSFNQNVLAPELFTGTLTVQPAQISDSSGTLTFTNTSIAAPQVTTGTLAVAPASLTDSSGAISMGSTNLVTTGNVQASAHKSLCCASEGCSGTSNYRAS
jgi:hypothetical protein